MAWDPVPLPPAEPSTPLEGLGESPALGCPWRRLELQAGLPDSAELWEGGLACPAQPPGLAQWRFIWNRQFPNKLCNLKIFKEKKKAEGRGARSSSASACGPQGHTTPGLSPGTGRGSVTTTPPLGFGLPHLRPRGPAGLLVFQRDRPLLQPQSPAPGLSPQPAVCDPCTAGPCTAPQLLLWTPRSISGSFHSPKPAASASTPGRREWTPSSGTWSPSLS